MDVYVNLCNFIKLTLDLIVLIGKVCYIVIKSTIQWLSPVYAKDISNEILLITGGGRGIGRQLALQFAKHKPKHIVLWGRNKVALQQTTHDVLALGVPCSFMICDVSSRECIYQRAEEIRKKVGVVTLLVNNAGAVNGQSIIDTSDSEMECILNTNCLAHIWTIKCFLPNMLSMNHGHIVSINSVLGLMGMKNCGDYCTSKYGMTGFYESLYWELQEANGIRITSVHPYTVSNKMFDGIRIRFPTLFPMLQEEYVAKKTVSAVLCNRKFVIIPKVMYLVIWCKSFLPVKAWFSILKFTGAASAMDGVKQKR